MKGEKWRKELLNAQREKAEQYREAKEALRLKDEVKRVAGMIETPADGYRVLAIMVVETSKTDLIGDDPLDSLDSLCWYLDGTGAELLDAMGINRDPVTTTDWIFGGCKNGQEIN